MKFLEALDKANNGKKMRAVKWAKGFYFYKDTLGEFIFNDGSPFKLHSSSWLFLWEEYEEVEETEKDYFDIGKALNLCISGHFVKALHWPEDSSLSFFRNNSKRNDILFKKYFDGEKEDYRPTLEDVKGKWEKIR